MRRGGSRAGKGPRHSRTGGGTRDRPEQQYPGSLNHFIQDCEQEEGEDSPSSVTTYMTGLISVLAMKETT